MPNGTYVEFDVEQYLSGEYSMGDYDNTETNERVVSPT